MISSQTHRDGSLSGGIPRQIGLWPQLYHEEIFTLHTKGDGSLSLNGHCAH